MNQVKIIAIAAVVLMTAYIGYYFLTQGLGEKPTDELSGIILDPPPDFYIIDQRADDVRLAFSTALDELLRLQRRSPERDKIGIRYVSKDGGEAHLLLDSKAQNLELVERKAAGTAVKSVWVGGLERRLAYFRQSGNLEPPGLSSVQRQNLYH